VNRHSLTRKLLVFDFDGVLAHSHEQLHQTVLDVCKSMRLAEPSLDDLKTKSAKEVLKIMGLGPLGTLRFVSLSRKLLGRKEIPLLERGMREFFTGWDKEDCILGIVSSSLQGRIHEFLEREKINMHFSFVSGGISLWGKDRALFDLTVKYRPLKALYVGDEERDIVSGHKAGYQVIAIGWGVKSSNFLKSYGPDYFVESPETLAELIKIL